MASPEHARALVTDSTTSTDPHQAAKWQEEAGIPVVSLPSWITIDGEQLPDSTIKTADFYNRLGKSTELIDTSGANAGQFTEAYEGLATAFGIKEILAPLSDVRLTCGVNSANAAVEVTRSKYPEMKVKVLDTKSVSVGAGILIPEALELLRQPIALEEVYRQLEEKAKNMRFFISVFDADYFLKSAGRRISQDGLEGIKTVTAALAIKLKIYPIVVLQEAKLDLIARAHGEKKIPGKMIELVEQEIAQGKSLKRAMVTHTNSETRAREMTNLLASKYQLGPDAISYCDAGKVLAVYAGQNCLGLACLFE